MKEDEKQRQNASMSHFRMDYSCDTSHTRIDHSMCNVGLPSFSIRNIKYLSNLAKGRSINIDVHHSPNNVRKWGRG